MSTSTSSDSRRFSFTATTLIGAGLALYSFAKLKQRVSRRKQALKAAQNTLAQQVERKPAEDTFEESNLFHGVRVLEVATHVAAPTVSRIMADLGAEVIKVESPGGDLFRKTLLLFEKPRSFGTMFEGQNLGKSSIVLDLKSEEGIQALKKLIKGADILLTNTRNRSLAELGLTYDQLRSEYPSLIYAQVSAWGMRGADKDLPGYDVGAFWAGSGAAVYTNEEGHYDTYTGALGDFTTGQFLLSGISLALRERLKTGRGRKVETSLLHAGVWCMAPHIVNAPIDETGKHVSPDFTKIPAKKIVDTIYQTKDEKPLTVCFSGSVSEESLAEDELRTLLGLSREEFSYEAARCKLAEMTHEEACELLQDAQRVYVCAFNSIEDKWNEMKQFTWKEDGKPLQRLYDIPPEDYVEQVLALPRIPFEFSCSKHIPLYRAPELGAHSKDILSRGWLSASAMPKGSHSSPSKDNSQPSVGQGAKAKPLAGVIVIELADVQKKHDLAVASTGSLLASMGATVLKIHASKSGASSDPLVRMAPRTYSQFHKLKTVRSEDDLPSLLGEASVVITDLSAAYLSSIGLDLDALNSKFPQLLVVHLVGSTRVEGRNAFAAAFAQSGCATSYSGLPAEKFPRYPDNFLELICSAFMTSAACSGLYSQERRKSGQLVTVSYEWLGIWLAQLALVFGLRDPKLQSFLVRDNLKSKFRSLLPTYTSRKTKDGMWLQLLGLETNRHLGKTLKALGVKWRTYAGLVVAGVCRVLPRVAMGSGSKIHKVEPLFECINRNMFAAFESLTYEEIQERFAKHDVWYAPYRMPSQLRSYEQLKANDMIREEAGVPEITNPIRIT